MNDSTVQPIIVMGGVNAILELASALPDQHMMLADDSSGLRDIKDCCSAAVMQYPANALAPRVPRSALACVNADHRVPLVALAGAAVVRVDQAPGRNRHVASNEGNAMQTLKAIASPSVFTCSDCGGVLFDLSTKRPVRLRRRTGYAFSLRSLAYMQEEMSKQPCGAACACCRKSKPCCGGWRRPRMRSRQMSHRMHCAKPTRLPTCSKRYPGLPKARLASK